MYQLIPNVDVLERNLLQFAEIIEADEVLLFERATFLVISHCQRKPHRDVHRFEKVSNIIKQFKLSCTKLAAQFQSMEVRNCNFAAYMDVFTPNTYVMVVCSDSTICKSADCVSEYMHNIVIWKNVQRDLLQDSYHDLSAKIRQTEISRNCDPNTTVATVLRVKLSEGSWPGNCLSVRRSKERRSPWFTRAVYWT